MLGRVFSYSFTTTHSLTKPCCWPAIIGEGIWPGFRSGAYALRHYDNLQHYEERLVTFTAPGADEFPDGSGDMIVHVQGLAGGEIESRTIIVHPPKSGGGNPDPRMQLAGEVGTSLNITFGGSPWCSYTLVLSNIRM